MTYCRTSRGSYRAVWGALVERWDRQIAAPYAGLTEAEKQSDRDQVGKYLSIIAGALANDE